MSELIDSLSKIDVTEIDGKTPPPKKLVDFIHGQAGTSRDELHHKLGFADDDASPGSHDHDGKNSRALWPADLALTDVTAGSSMAQFAAAINAINAALRAKMEQA